MEVSSRGKLRSRRFQKHLDNTKFKTSKKIFGMNLLYGNMYWHWSFNHKHNLQNTGKNDRIDLNSVAAVPDGLRMAIFAEGCYLILGLK